MASFSRGNGGDKKGGGGGGSRKRLVIEDEGEEAAELAKLAAAEEDVRRLRREIEVVQAQIADVEAKMKRLEDTDGASFSSDLSPFQQRRLASAESYFDSLEKERSQLRQQGISLYQRIGGSLNHKAAQIGAVTEIKSRRPQLWQVEGFIRGSKRSSGIRAFLYAMASDESGLAVSDSSQTGATSSAASSSAKPNRKDVFQDCVWYENDDLHFRILFHSAESGQRFGNKLSEHKHIVDNLAITDPILLGKQYHTIGIKRADYDSDDESSSASSQIISMQVTKAEPTEMITRFQSIELAQLLQLGYDLEKAHLVHEFELKRRRKAEELDWKDDCNNNRIVLTSSLHKIFDGRRNGEGREMRVPLMLIEAVDGLPGTAPDIQVPEMLQEGREKRYRVWLKVTALDEMTMTGIICRLKVGCFVHTIDTSGHREVYTHVHVLDPDLFKANLEWRAADTRKQWDL